MYVFGSAVSLFVSDFVRRKLGDSMSLPYTMAFSNTPGSLKPINIRNTSVVGMSCAVVPSCRAGMCITIISCANDFRVTGISDSSVIGNEDLHKIVDYIEQAILQYVEIGHQISGVDEKKDN